jgi:hypothetical protein
MGSFLGWFVEISVPVQQIFVSCLGCSSQPGTIYYFPHRTLFHLISPHRPTTWAGNRDGSSVTVSLLKPPRGIAKYYVAVLNLWGLVGPTIIYGFLIRKLTSMLYYLFYNVIF